MPLVYWCCGFGLAFLEVCATVEGPGMSALVTGGGCHASVALLGGRGGLGALLSGRR